MSLSGIEQVEQACKTMNEDRAAPTIVRYSLAANAVETSNIVGKQLRVGRDRLVPEFNFMDPRAIGMWDMSEKNTTEVAVWALDATEAGIDGTHEGGRPPANVDGTPHETLADQTVRLRQLLSVLETQYSGDTILLVFPDGTGPALLTCLIGGIPLSRVHEFEFKPGELRLDINYNSARVLAENGPTDEYLERLEEGKLQLKRLLENPEESNLDVRDLQFERDMELEKEKKMKLEREQALRLEEEARMKKERQLAEMKRREEKELEIKLKREAQLAELQRKQEESRMKRNAQNAEASQRKEFDRLVEFNEEPGGLNILAAGGALVCAGGAAYLFSQGEEDTERKPVDRCSDYASSNEVSASDVEVTADAQKESERVKTEDQTSHEAEGEANLKAEKEEEGSNLMTEEDTVLEVEDEDDTRTQENNDPKLETEDVAADEKNRQKEKNIREQTWNPDEDDGGLAWLNTLSEIIKEEDQELEK